MDFKISEILNFSLEEYSKYFEQPEFGINFANEILNSQNLSLIPERITEGSSLVFKLGDELILKITPPFFNDSFETEIKATNYVSKNFSYQVPEIINSGQFENWNYLITKRVRGQQIYKVFKSFTFEDKKNFSSQLGNMLFELRQIKGLEIKRDFGNWNTFLKNRLDNQYQIHLEKDNSIEWVEKITTFIESQKGNLLALDSNYFVHADINYQHVMVEQKNDTWEVTGLIDFADSITAPCEIEFTLPFIDFFKGSYDLQNNLLISSKYNKILSSKEFSNLLMALTLQNRFMAFHDWFSKELKNSVNSMEDLVKIVFPYTKSC